MGIPIDVITNFKIFTPERNKKLKKICIALAQNDSIMAMTHLAMANEYEKNGSPSKTTEAQFHHTVSEIARLTQELRELY